MRRALWACVTVIGCSGPSPVGTGGGGGAGATTTDTTTSTQTDVSSTTVGSGGASTTSSAGGAQVGGGGASAGTGGTSTSGTTSSTGGNECAGAADGTVCATGTCCAGVCATDFLDDPQNCGSCGRVCGSGTCTGTACAAQLIASSTVEIADISTNATHVYWATYGGHSPTWSPTEGGVYRYRLATEAIEPVLPSQNWHSGVLPRGNLLYISDFGEVAAGAGVYTCPIDSCTGNRTKLASSFAYSYPCTHLVSSANHVLGCFVDASAGAVFYCSGTNCNNYTNGTGGTSGRFVAADQGIAYYSSAALSNITAVIESTLATTTYASNLGAPEVLTSGKDGYLYWQDTSASAIRRSTVGQFAGTIETLITGLGVVNDFAVDNGHVYWIGKNGVVRACDVASCAATNHALGTFAGDGWRMALTPTHVYFSTNESTQTTYQLLRVPR